MDIMEKIYAQAAADPQRIAFPEATDQKILQAARECCDKGLIIPVLVGDVTQIRSAASELGIGLDGMEFFDTADEEPD